VLFKQKTIWWPTRWGWLAILVAVILPPALYIWKGESLLAITSREPADILVVEGWIGADGIEAAAREFHDGHYKYIVTNGGYTSRMWGVRSWSFAEMAAHQLEALGVPPNQILAAKSLPSEQHRTFDSAVAVKNLLADQNIQAVGMNILTRGSHARRSRLVNSKVENIPVGVIAWMPSSYAGKPWWESSARAKDFLTESFAFFFEALFNSGRLSNSPTPK
jgi:hypothetical protein